MGRPLSEAANALIVNRIDLLRINNSQFLYNFSIIVGNKIVVVNELTFLLRLCKEKALPSPLDGSATCRFGWGAYFASTILCVSMCPAERRV